MSDKFKEDKAAYDRARYQANREKIIARTKLYKKNNKEKIYAYHKAYREANKEKLNAYHRAYVQNNKEKINAHKKAYREANKEKINATAKAWSRANKDKRSAAVAKRRALKINQIPIQVRDCPIEKKRLYQTYKLCALFTKITGVQHHVDHMWPLSDGGPHWSGNLQIITATENLSKNATVDPSIKATIQEMLKDIKDVY